MGLKRFDYKLKDNTKKKSIIVASIIVLVLIIGITLYATYAAYSVTKSYNVIQGKVKTFIKPDLAIKVRLIDTEGNISLADEFPSNLEYVYNADKSSCKNGSIINFDADKWTATIDASGKDKCTLYFEQIDANALTQ